MWYNLNIAFRNLRRNGLYSIINVAGLAVGMASVMLILLWVWDELTYDNFYERPDDIQLVIAHVAMDAAVNPWQATASAVSHVAREKIAGVDNACAVNPNYDLGYLEYNGTKFFGNRYITADTTFFKIFTTSFVEGAANTAWPDPYAVVLTETTARKIFGKEPAVGKVLKGGNGRGKEEDVYYVSGVVKDPPRNTILPYDAVFSFERSRHKNSWKNWSWYNFLLLHPDASGTQVCRKLLELQQQNNPQLPVRSFSLQALSAMRLYGPGGEATGMASVRLFSLIAVVLLLIACVNYVNLSTARSNKRGKEIAVRKVMGAGKASLMKQLMLETGVLCLASLIAALLLVVLLLPFYNGITGKSFDYVPADPMVWVIFLGALLLTFLLSGIYPALKLAAFDPLRTIYAQHTGHRSFWSLRRLLVLFQFTSVAALVVMTLVLNRQLHYIQHKHLGFDKEQVLAMDVFKNLDIRQHYESFKTELEKAPAIAGVTGSIGSITWAGYRDNITWQGMPDAADLMVSVWGVDRNIFEVLNISLAAGSGFTGTGADNARCYLNETAVKVMRLENPVGKTISVPGRNYTATIAGVANDFHFEPLSRPIAPLLMCFSDRMDSIPEQITNVYVKIRPGMIKEALSVIERVWKIYSPDFPLTYAFLDDTINALYRSEQQRGSLFNYFSLVAILISCLGLFGLVTYTAETRTREIGIRKVLGAGTGYIVWMLSKEFLVLLCLALAVAFPLGYYWLDKLLQDYAYRISIAWWMFALAALLVLLLTLLTVGWRAWRSAAANPVDAIKTA